MFTDTHCHLTHLPGAAGAAVEEARAHGVNTMITVGTDLASSAECVQVASSHEGVYAAVGIHPNDSIEATRRRSCPHRGPCGASVGDGGR